MMFKKAIYWGTVVFVLVALSWETVMLTTLLSSQELELIWPIGLFIALMVIIAAWTSRPH